MSKQREKKVTFSLEDIVGETAKPLDINVVGEGDEGAPLSRLTIMVFEHPNVFEIIVTYTGRFGEATVAAQKVAAALAQYAREAGRF